VFTAILIATGLLSGVVFRVAVILMGATMLAVIGTVDDRVTVSPKWRLLAECAAAVAVWSAHFGFTAFDSSALDLGLTIVWVVGIVNAFNLIDNIDGACATLAGISAVGTGALSLIHGDWHLATVSLAITGACAGFLRHNLARPARIFLGDGGSMPLGFLIACLAMVAMRGRGLGSGELFACGLLVGLPVLDTSLVMISRRRRGLSVLTAGRDHLTHRLLRKLRTPGRVALLLAVVQTVLVTLSVIGDRNGEAVLIVVGVISLALGATALVFLESPTWTAEAAPVVAGASSPGESRPLASPVLLAARVFDVARSEPTGSTTLATSAQARDLEPK
jgi:UDP-GlcNAc:undecaprenyl-phosphate GlcNAc-1-phosphate transferase